LKIQGEPGKHVPGVAPPGPPGRPGEMVGFKEKINFLIKKSSVPMILN